MVGFICVFSHRAVMKKNNNSLTKDEILAFLRVFLMYKQRIQRLTRRLQQIHLNFYLLMIVSKFKFLKN
jgi:hypothetical protein